MREFEHEGLLAGDEAAQQQRRREGEQHARRVQRDDGDKGAGEEGGGDGEIDGHLRPAADVAEDGDHPPLQRLVFQPARRQNGSGGAAEAHQQRKGGAAGQPDAAEDAVGEEGERREQAALLKQGKRQLEQYDLREEGEQHARRAAQRAQKLPRDGRARPLRRRGEPIARPREQPFERLFGEHARHPAREGEEKDGQQDERKQRQRKFRI